jgi:hypothetical protein
MRVSGIATIKNIIKLGYTFFEAVLSAFPLCDEILINDGGSEDETQKYLELLAQTFPEKNIRIFDFHWGGRNCCRQFDETLNRLIELASGDWLIEIQGDEIWHEKDIETVKRVIDFANQNGYNSIRQWCKTCSWTQVDSYQYKNVRIVKKIKGLRSTEWGDNFVMGENTSPQEGYTSHNVPPELVTDEFVYYHLHRPFPENRVLQDEAMAYMNSAGDPPRTEVFEAVKRIDWKRVPLPRPEEVLDELPAIVKGLSQFRRYRVREELFSRAWLREITGLEY